MLLTVFHASCGYLPFWKDCSDKATNFGKNNQTLGFQTLG